MYWKTERFHFDAPMKQNGVRQLMLQRKAYVYERIERLRDLYFMCEDEQEDAKINSLMDHLDALFVRIDSLVMRKTG